MEKRKNPRIVVSNMQIDVSDGIGCCSGTVRDVSPVGLCLADVAKRFGKNIEAFTVVASSENRYFKFRVRSRWEQTERLGKRLGVEIHEPPGQWIEYVSSLVSRDRKK